MTRGRSGGHLPLPDKCSGEEGSSNSEFLSLSNFVTESPKDDLIDIVQGESFRDFESDIPLPHRRIRNSDVTPPTNPFCFQLMSPAMRKTSSANDSFIGERCRHSSSFVRASQRSLQFKYAVSSLTGFHYMPSTTHITTINRLKRSQ